MAPGLQVPMLALRAAVPKVSLSIKSGFLTLVLSATHTELLKVSENKFIQK